VAQDWREERRCLHNLDPRRSPAVVGWPASHLGEGGDSMRQTQLEFYIKAYELEHELLKKAALRNEELMSIIRMLVEQLEEKNK
jgi:hypothetical protein